MIKTAIFFFQIHLFVYLKEQQRGGDTDGHLPSAGSLSERLQQQGPGPAEAQESLQGWQEDKVLELSPVTCHQAHWQRARLEAEQPGPKRVPSCEMPAITASASLAPSGGTESITNMPGPSPARSIQEPHQIPIYVHLGFRRQDSRMIRKKKSAT